MPSLQTILLLLTQYGYFLLLPLAIIEGPIVTIIAAFLASTGVLNVYIVYIICVIGDVIGDAIYYWIGRAGRYSFIPRYGKYLGITETKITLAEEHYAKHLWKTLLFGKITQAPILLIIVVAGAIRANFWKFIFFIFIITLPKVLIFTFIGFYAGKYYESIGRGLDMVLAVSAVAVVVGYMFYRIFKARKMQNNLT